MERHETINLRQLACCSVPLSESSFAQTLRWLSFYRIWLSPKGLYYESTATYSEKFTHYPRHRTLVNRTRAERICLELIDEELLVVQEIELIAI